MLVLAVAACSTPKPPPAVTPAPKPAPAAPAPKPAWKPAKVVPDAVTVPGGRLHTVKRGETGIAIAQAYGVPWSKVVAANKLKPPYALEVGQKLLLPSTKAAAAATANMTVEQRAAAFSVNIDDLITGSAPAEKPVTTSKAPSAASAEAPTASIALVWPVEGRLLSSFGAKPGGRYNDGINLKVTKGGAVRAAADGTVAYAGDAIPGFGNLLLIKHPGGWVTAYAHNEALLVTLGTKVRAGEPIARAGASGAVDTPQLHFEVRRGRTAVDPLRYLPPRG
ncbi:LysM peptidoglycan-binding domain-containing protein [Polymorphobacter arshaanensis]|uniref:LysM peptidoglycan-binding domain-containing protein n=2 Tax=Glacieibacterium arshaanense TaxID=2511025 RepID=A0A4Y9EQ32_9SPHN|nr:LysM peptidoglycan-binding domain-containing protein [Polymorphobacter arshaanensis]